jgi:exopolyphosphatase / guanosine-5'-triphosphate,3'-diphosphate pyrophosphatase
MVQGQLGRPPRDVTGIACRCPFGCPAVIETAPTLHGGPNPTLLYLTCPTVVKAVSQVESRGAVKRFRDACRDDESLRGALERLTDLYRARRTELGGAPATAGQATEAAPVSPAAPRFPPEAGIGGPESPEVASCLHAYAAAMLAVFSGWLGEEGTAGESAGVLGAVWDRFLPPPDDCWCGDRTCGQWDTGSRPAAIDVGTISVRLLVAEMEAGRPRQLVRRVEITRLGEGLRPGGPLGDAAKARTGEVVGRFVAEARSAGADSIVLAATSAARDAADGAGFIAGLGRTYGLNAAVLSGEREAQLAYAGVTSSVPGDPLVLDIGGGSSEVIVRRGRAGVAAVSLDIGASRATESWLKTDPPAAAELAAAEAEATRAFDGVHAMCGWAPGGPDRPAGRPPARLVAVAGTVTTLACLDAGLEVYDSEAIHLRTLTLESVRRLVVGLSGMTTAERAALPCVQAGRAPVLVGGAVILLAAMETLGYDRLTVCERDMLDGLVLCGLG